MCASGCCRRRGRNSRQPSGGASGIGFAVAERSASGGVKVVLADIEEDSLNSAASALRASGANAIGVQTDVSDPESVHNLALRTIDEFAGVHILCNNAGVGVEGSGATYRVDEKRYSARRARSGHVKTPHIVRDAWPTHFARRAALYGPGRGKSIRRDPPPLVR